MSESKDLVDLCVFFFWESVSLEGHGVLAQNTWGGHPLNPIERDGFGPTRCNVVFIYFWSWCFPLFSGLFEEMVKKSEEQNKAMLRCLTLKFPHVWLGSGNRLQAVELVEAEKQVALAKSKERWGGVTGLWLVKGSLLVQKCRVTKGQAGIGGRTCKWLGWECDVPKSGQENDEKRRGNETRKHENPRVPETTSQGCIRCIRSSGRSWFIAATAGQCSEVR